MNQEERNLSVLAYIFIIGWLISYIQLSKNRGELLTFHCRQALGLHIFSAINTLVLFKFVPWVCAIISFGLFILWIIAVVGAYRGEFKYVPVFGEDFQKWFNFIE